jgi:HAD superfamily hydrolase (TIGR01662 family)
MAIVGAQIEAVVFDVGETIVDETREYGTWADWLGVPRHTFSAMFGAVIAQGRDYRETFQHFRPGFDLREERERRAVAGEPETIGPEDLYPDAAECLAAMKAQGVLVVLAGNQTARVEGLLREMTLPVDLIGTSDGWGVEKPSTGFFERVVKECRTAPERILYVGDRLDNDIRPARAAGMQTAFVRRGPWGYIFADHPELDGCLFRLTSLEELPELIRKYNEGPSDELGAALPGV